MKVAVLLCFLAVVISSTLAGTVPPPYRNPYPNGCIYVNGHCHHGCPDGTHSYTTGCGHKMPEATCANPNPVLDTRGKICDFTACYCNPPTLRDEKSNTCVLPEACPKEVAEQE